MPSSRCAFCAACNAEAFITTHCRDDESENNWLRESNTQVAENQHIDRVRHELCCTKVQYQICNHESAEQTGTIPDGHEQRQR